MACLNKTYPSVSALPLPARWQRPAWVKMMIILVEAFREALAMRRAMPQRLDDE
jgi:hypothetical protein